MSLSPDPQFWDSVRAVRAALDRCNGGDDLIALPICHVKRILAVVDVPYSEHMETMQRASDYLAAVRFLGDAMRWGGVKS